MIAKFKIIHLLQYTLVGLEIRYDLIKRVKAINVFCIVFGWAGKIFTQIPVFLRLLYSFGVFKLSDIWKGSNTIILTLKL